MASIISHGFFALIMGKAVTTVSMPWRFWLLTIVCVNLPDADVIAFKFGIPYGDMFGHRGFTHSLLFAVIVGLFVAFVFFITKPWRTRLLLGLYFISIIASHGIIDAMTNGGLGVGFFIPFDESRYFLPWRPIVVSPIGISSFFSEWGKRVILSEIIWIGIPTMVFAIVITIGKRIFFTVKHDAAAQTKNTE